MKVTLVRHGSTAMNEESVIIGHLGTPLSAKGRREAAAVGKRLTEERFDAIVSSDLPRAKETAEIIRGCLRHAPPLAFHKELREIDYGELAGRKKDDMKGQYPRYHQDVSFKNPGGESFDELAQRAVSFVKRLEKKHKHVLIITHAGCIRALVSFLRREALRDNLNMRISHTAIAEGELTEGRPKGAEFVQE